MGEGMGFTLRAMLSRAEVRLSMSAETPVEDQRPERTVRVTPMLTCPPCTSMFPIPGLPAAFPSSLLTGPCTVFAGRRTPLQKRTLLRWLLGPR